MNGQYFDVTALICGQVRMDTFRSMLQFLQQTGIVLQARNNVTVSSGLCLKPCDFSVEQTQLKCEDLQSDINETKVSTTYTRTTIIKTI
jgi:hypothetical protein